MQDTNKGESKQETKWTKEKRGVKDGMQEINKK